MRINEHIINKYIKSIANINTQKTYRLSLNKFYKFIQENKITDLNQKNINTILHDYKAHLNKQHYKAITINQHLIILKTFINDYTPLEYTKNLKLIKTEKRKPRYLTIKQIQTALKYTDNKTDQLIIQLLTSTGLRIHEALKITKKELRNKDEEGHSIITIIGKNTKRRQIAIPKTLTRELQRYSKENKKYLFESKRQPLQPISTRGIQYRFRKLAQKIDNAENTNFYIENLKPHNLRHTFAIEALKSNEINYVKEFLGHENIATTQIYTDLKEKEVIDRFKDMKII